jgi:hypothetical protein
MVTNQERVQPHKVYFYSCRGIQRSCAVRLCAFALSVADCGWAARVEPLTEE